MAKAFNFVIRNIKKTRKYRPQVPQRYANTHKCLGPTWGWWNTETSYDISSSVSLHLIMYCTQLNFALPHRLHESEGKPKSIFLTLSTYQETYVSGILCYDCRDWKCDRTIKFFQKWIGNPFLKVSFKNHNPLSKIPTLIWESMNFTCSFPCNS